MAEKEISNIIKLQIEARTVPRVIPRTTFKAMFRIRMRVIPSLNFRMSISVTTITLLS